MPVFNNILAGAAGQSSGSADDYVIDRSVRFDSATGAYFSRTATGGNRKTWTWSAWIKRNTFNNEVLFMAKGSGANPHNGIWIENNRLALQSYPYSFTVVADNLLRDTSSWYSFVVSFDTTIASPASDRIKIWINGELVTQFNGTPGYPDEDFESIINDNGQNFHIGQWDSSYNRYFDGQMAEVHFIDGQAITDPDGVFGKFDSTTGEWVPIEFTGSHNVGTGDNGFYLDFSDTSNIGKDNSGDGNDWTKHNINSFDVLRDSPTIDVDNNVGNYATLNWNDSPNNQYGTLTNGALDFVGDTSAYSMLRATQPIPATGKYFYEALFSGNAYQSRTSGSQHTAFGLCKTNTAISSITDGNSCWLADNGYGTVFSSTKTEWYGGDIDQNKVVGVAVNREANQAFFFVDGELVQVANLGEDGYDDLSPFGYSYNNTQTSLSCSFGQKDFVHYPVQSSLVTGDSTNSGYNSTKMFDGSTSTYMSHGAFGGTAYWYPYLKEVTSLKVYLQTGSRSEQIIVYGNLGSQTFTYSANTSGSWHTISLTNIGSEVDYVQIGPRGQGGEYIDVGGWEVNGTVITDSNTPTGFDRIYNGILPSPAIANGRTQFNTVLRNGFGTGGGTVNVGFKPGLLWEKTRSTSGNHYLYDAVRGVGKILFPNSANPETNDTNLDQVSSFTSSGYTLGGNEWATNVTLVGWAWKEGSLVTNSAYNQSEAWSSKLSTYQYSFGSEPAINLFDGDTSTSFYSSSTSGAGIKFVPTTSITGSIELYLRNGDTVNSTFSYSLDNGTTFTNLTTTAGNGSYVSIGNQTITNTNGIIVRHVTTAGTNSVNWRAIKVDNKVLVDAGFVPAGSQNDNVYIDDQAFSGGLSGTGSGGNFPSGEGATLAFDGDVTTRARWTGTSDGVLTATLPTAISATRLRVKGHFFKNSSTANEDVMISVNGGTYVVPSDAGLTTFAAIQAASGNNLFIDCSSLITGGQVSSVAIKRRGTVSSASGLTIYAIEVDGKILVDNNASPPNVPSLATTCHINADAGMSIVTYQANLTVNDTIYHGLGVKPHFAIFKNRDNTGGDGQVDWGVYHHDLGATKIMELNQTFGEQTMGGPFNNIEPDSYKFTLGTGGHSYLTNGPAGDDFMGYIFREIPGFSKFSVYTGSGSQKFIQCGFRPAWVMIKRYTDNTVGEWGIYDNTREPYNEIQKKVWANNSSSEEDHPNNSIDFVSNGFVIDPGGDAPNVQYTNNGSVGYLFAAFASSPFKHSRAR